MTINEGFNTLLAKLTPSRTETTAVASHRNSIKTCLVSNYSITNYFKSGSFGNGTSINGFSDVDYFAVFPADKLYKDSNYSLRKVRDTLNTRFSSTNVKVDDPTVVCPFGTLAAETTEIVPCYKYSEKNGYPIYKMSDTNGSWMTSSPTMHNDYIKKENDRLSGKLKPLIRLIKAWKYYRNVPISSFYLELRIAYLMKDETSILYNYDIKTIISWLYDNDLPRIQDPMGVAGYIYPCNSEAKKTDAISKLKTAKSRVINARNYEDQDNFSEAFKYWNLFFDGKFPTY